MKFCNKIISVVSTLGAKSPLCAAQSLSAKKLVALGLVNLLLTTSALAGKPTGLPAAPSNLAATAVSASQINLGWQDNSSNESGFNIQRAPTSSGAWTQIGSVGAGATTYADTGLSASTTYYYRVYAYNSKGNSGYSAVAVATTQAAAPACSYSCAPLNASYSSSGGGASVTVTAGTSCNWTASSSATWITITGGASGSGNGTVNYSVAANTSSSSLTGTMTIAGQTITVTQAGAAACAYSCSPLNASYASSAASGSVNVTAGTGCAWSATANAAWITIASGASSSGNSAVNYSVAANTSTASRTGTMTIAGGQFTVTQAGAAQTSSLGQAVDNTALTLTTGGDASWLAETSVSFSGGSAAQSGLITAGQTSWMETTATGPATLSFYWKVSSESGWDLLHFYLDGVEQTSISGEVDWQQKSFSIASGSHTLHWAYTKDAFCCAGGSDRGWVDQVQLSGSTCAYALSSTSASLAAAGGSSSVSVTAAAGCSWTASTTYNWIHSTSSGSGSGTVNYSVDANSSTSSRSGTITVGGQTFTVSQAGTSCSYALSASSASYTSAGGSGSVSVTAGSGCAWTGTTSYAWLHTTSSGNGNGAVGYTADANASASSRSGTITVAGQTLTVTQSANQAPVAVAGPNQSVSVATTISFNGSSSYDPDGTIASYSWNFGDGNTGSGASVFHVFAVVGTYTVTLTVTDNLGATASATALATVAALADTTPPSVSVTAPASGSTVSNTVTLSASASDNVGVARVEFYCDSVVTPLGTATSAPYTSPCNTTAMANGSHSFYAKAYDAAGNAANSASVTVTVNNGAPTGTPGQVQWYRDIVSGQMLTAGMATDHSNNVVIAGGFTLNADFGGGALSNPAGLNAFVAKYNSQNQLLWAKNLEAGTVDARAMGVAVDSQNNVIVVGFFKGSLDFGGGTVIPNTDSSGQTMDIFVAKYSPAGDLLWVKHFGGSPLGNDAGYAVAVDGSDNVVFAAQFQATIDFGTGPINGSYYGMALVKLRSADGTAIWAKGWGGSSYNYPNSLAIDRSGDVVVTGQLNGPTDIGGGTTGSGGIYLAKYSGATGSYQWAKVFGGGAGGWGVATDPNTGNIVVTGDALGTVDFGGGANVSAGSEIFVAGFDTSGNYLWQKFLAASGGSGYGTAVRIDSNGVLALAGTVTGWINFGGSTLSARGRFVASYAISGNSLVYRWGQTTSDGAYGTAVAFDGLNHILTAGSVGYHGFAAQYTE